MWHGSREKRQVTTLTTVRIVDVRRHIVVARLASNDKRACDQSAGRGGPWAACIRHITEGTHVLQDRESESLQAPPREQWSGQLGFLIAAIGSAIGLGNIWRFPGVAYTNGGGAFIVPYVIALLAAGLPILFLDYALGHRFRGSPPAVFRRLSTRLEWLGWFQVFICFVIMTYYAVVVAWSLRYMFFSVNVAWGDDAAGFFQQLHRDGPARL